MSEIKRLIEKGESKTVEFKETLPGGNHIAKTVISFSNITSPGALPRSLEIDDIIAGRSEIRNKVIARFFKEIDFIEQWGFGIRKMIRLLKEHGLEPPQFRESGLFFKITIFKKRRDTEEKTKEIAMKTTAKNTEEKPEETTAKTTMKTTAKKGEEITTTKTQKGFIDKPFEVSESPGDAAEETQGTTIKSTMKTTAKTTAKKTKEKSEETTAKKAEEIPAKIIRLIKANPNINLAHLSKQLNITKEGVRYHLKNLKLAGILKRIGTSRSGYWEINENI